MKLQDLQQKITVAIEKKDLREVYRLQRTLVSSFEAQALAVKKVMSNKGGMTGGTDGIVWKSPQNYWDAIHELARMVKDNKNYKAQPARRVYIPKPNSPGEKRPLGIPTMTDRAMQALYHFGVDPAVETNSDPNSYGFRKSRSTHDAITAIRSIMDKKTHPRWILEADISKCFDRISHDFLLKHTPICHKHMLKEWLKAGIMEEMNYYDTNEGTPQGGIMSPTLSNIALNGIEGLIKERIPKIKGISQGIHVVRYADDMIITGKSKEIVLKCKEILSEFLAVRGLELNERKTLITHVKDGFDFLGFNIRRLEYNAKFNKASDQESTLIIKPSKKGIQKLVTKIKDIINTHNPIEKIIGDLNPVLRG